MDNPEGLIGSGAIFLAILAFIRFFIWNQIKSLRGDVVFLNDKVDRIEAKYDEERGLKHKALNDVSRSVMALELVQRLAAECTCGVLRPLTEILDRLSEEFETVRIRHEQETR